MMPRRLPAGPSSYGLAGPTLGVVVAVVRPVWDQRRLSSGAGVVTHVVAVVGAEAIAVPV